MFTEADIFSLCLSVEFDKVMEKRQTRSERNVKIFLVMVLKAVVVYLADSAKKALL